MKYLKLIDEFESQLNSVESYDENILFKAEKNIVIIETYIKRLRRQVIQNGFDSIHEEITFFKHVKPRFFGKLIYHVKLYNIESKRPRGSAKFQVEYFDAEIKKMEIYFNDHLEFYRYYQFGATSLDEQYFLRGQSDLRSPNESYHYYTDGEFSTCHDITVSTILAFNMLIKYLRQEIENLKTASSSAEIRKLPKLSWTASKTELTELIYALHSSGAINRGAADIKEMATLFERIFNINLGNFYHTFIEIRARKTSNTKFLDKLVDALTKRFSDLDE